MRAAWLAFSVVGFLAAPAAAEPNTVRCSLQRTGDAFAGTCDIPCAVNALAINIDGPRPGFSCSTPPRRVNATLRRMGAFDDFLGTMQGKEPEDPTRFSVILPKAGAPGVAKLPYGWFALAEARETGDALELVALANRQLPPTADDLRIVDRARDLLADESRWNRRDTRECPDGAPTVSLFCALMRATTEISGGVHYRQPAMQAVREVLNEVGGDRVKLHRLMDYNNHPDTTLADLHALLASVRQRLETRGAR